MDENTTLRKMYNSFTKETGERVQFLMIHASDLDWEMNVDWPSEDDWRGRPSWAIADRGTIYEYHNAPKEILDFEFDPGFGSPEAPAILAWSDSYVISIHEYDGAQWLEWFPRNPQIK